MTKQKLLNIPVDITINHFSKKDPLIHIAKRFLRNNFKNCLENL